MTSRTHLLSRLVAATALLVAGLGWHAPPAAAQISNDRPESTTYVLDQSTLNGGGGTSTSSSYRLDGSLSQPATVGNTTSASYIVQSGFWTSLATRATLRVENSGTGDGTVTGRGIDCDFTGAASSGDCLETFVDGTTVELVAVPDPSNQLDGWVGCDEVLTTSNDSDTCRVTLNDSRTVTVIFTLQATIGDRVWRDIDGDGVQDPGEPGIDGVTVVLSDAGGFLRTQTTVGDGSYTFVDVPPGAYTLSIDTATLPPGVVPSFDPDGIATPHTAQVTVASGEDLVTADFGYQPLVGLTLTKVDDVADGETLPGAETLTYTITVTNHGPAPATGVEVVDILPVGTTLVGTSGCLEDPNGAPTCTLGALGIGETKSYTIEVSIDDAPPETITNTATVTSIEVDTNFGDNSDSETTALDATPPNVTQITTTPPAPGGTLDECETLNGNALVRVRVQFDEPVRDLPGSGSQGDVTSLSSWSLIEAGPDRELQTTSCGAPAGDDRVEPIESVAYDSASNTATLEFPRPIQRGLYRLFACGDGPNAIVDLGGTPLDGDGDGVAGGDFALRFRIDARNKLRNGSFDCDLDPWTVEADRADEIEHVATDRDASSDSGSARVERLGSDVELALSQCAPLAVGSDAVPMRIGATFRPESDLAFELGCRFYADAACGGTGSSWRGLLGTLEPSGWESLSGAVSAPAGSSSVLCSVLIQPSPLVASDDYEVLIDEVWLTDDLALFEDGFESGGTSAWSDAVP